MKIGLVVVTFFPTEEDLAKISILQQHYVVSVNDNTRDNLGIATAQNEGIRTLLKQGVDYIILLDQDSRVSTEFPQQMVDEYERIRHDFPTLAALGPTLDYHKPCNDLQGFVRQREIIASGMCFSVEALQQVGYMEDELFIDFVDFEWCWRARAKGWECGRTTRVTMLHRVGTCNINLCGYRIFISKPNRYYYLYRNHLRLSRRDYVPVQWKIATGIKHLVRFFYLPCIMGSCSTLKYMWKGWAAAR